MRKRTGYLLGLLFVAVVAQPTSVFGASITVETYSGGGGTFVTNVWVATAQGFTTPALMTELEEYEFTLEGRSEPGTVSFSIYALGPSGPTGPALYSNTAAWGTAQTNITFSNINLSLVSGMQYAATIDLLGYSGLSVHYTDDAYAGGSGYWAFNPSGPWSNYADLDHRFRAVFSDGALAVPDSSSVLILAATAFAAVMLLGSAIKI